MRLCRLPFLILLLITNVFPVQCFVPEEFFRFLFDLWCIPFPFLPFCVKPESLGTVYIDFYRTYEVHSVLGGFVSWKKYAISSFRVHQQLWELNFWFKDRVNFRLGSVQDYNYPGMYRVTKPFELTPCEHLKTNATTGGLFNPRRISAVYSKEYSYGDEGFFGCASRVFAPLGGDSAPFVSLANTRVYNHPLLFPIPIDGNVFATTLAHEIGHLLGFDHTLSREPAPYVQHFNFCGLDLKYPAFSAEDSFEVYDEYGVSTVYDHAEWNGRLNIMSGGVPPDSLNPIDWGFLYHSGYSEVFDEIMRCWFAMSTEEDE